MYFGAKIQIGSLMENEARFARKFNELLIQKFIGKISRNVLPIFEPKL